MNTSYKGRGGSPKPHSLAFVGVTCRITLPCQSADKFYKLVNGFTVDHSKSETQTKRINSVISFPNFKRINYGKTQILQNSILNY